MLDKVPWPEGFYPAAMPCPETENIAKNTPCQERAVPLPAAAPTHTPVRSRLSKPVSRASAGAATAVTSRHPARLSTRSVGASGASSSRCPPFSRTQRSRRSSCRALQPLARVILLTHQALSLLSNPPPLAHPAPTASSSAPLNRFYTAVPQQYQLQYLNLPRYASQVDPTPGTTAPSSSSAVTEC